MNKREIDSFVRDSEAQAKMHVARWKELQPPLQAKIVKTLRHGGYLSEAAAKEAAFHLTDWIVDLHDLIELFESARWNPARAQKVLTAFVVHAPNHLAAAHRIMLGDPLTDVFQLGAVKGSGRGKRPPGAPYPEQRRATARAKRKGTS